VVVGFAGSGNMAAAMARGWAGAEGGPAEMLFTDSGSGRAVALAEEVGGRALSSNAELSELSDLLVLAVKPKALDEVAHEVQASAAVVSLLGATPVSRIADAFPAATAMRVMPNLAVEVRQGVLCFAVAPGADEAPLAEVVSLLSLLGRVVALGDEQFDAATAVMGCSPAYFALTVEAIAEAGAAEGLDAELARSLTVDAAAGTAELLRERDPAEVRDAVASPGGSTEAGLAALERLSVADAFAEAVRASLARMRE
jgi:pyrroline-5-carboxylate reductase